MTRRNFHFFMLLKASGGCCSRDKLWNTNSRRTDVFFAICHIMLGPNHMDMDFVRIPNRMTININKFLLSFLSV